MEENTADDVDVVLVAARHAMERAYGPSGSPKVGAALLADNGEIFAACALISVQPGCSVSATEGALARAVSEGATAFQRLVVVSDGEVPRFPGAGARQLLAELAPGLTVIAETVGGGRMMEDIEALLPHPSRQDGG